MFLMIRRRGAPPLLGSFPRAADVALDSFSSGADLTPRSYGLLFTYFIQGFLRHKSALGAYATYPGHAGGEGSAEERHHNRMEGFTRLAPLMAAWLYGGRSAAVTLCTGERVDVAAHLRAGILAGTNPASPEYWGQIGHHDSRMVESADVALAVWLSREQIWDAMSAEERGHVAAWLAGADGKRTVDNNWHLFVVLVDTVLHSLGCPFDPAERSHRYARARSFYRGDGWFSDGPEDKFDYYNVWGFHYALDWIRRIDPRWDPTFLDTVRRDLAANFKYFFGPNGFPIMGRSVCYRLATPAALVSASLFDPQLVTPGEARRAMDLAWRYFIRNGAVARGNVTQGYFEHDPRILDSYSGPASCLWSLRSLIVAFSLPDGSDFWRGPASPLPVEKGDFVLEMPAIGWRVIGDSAKADVRIELEANAARPEPRLEPVSAKDRVLNLLLGRGRRPSNLSAKYGRHVYSSVHPFCVDEDQQ